MYLQNYNITTDLLCELFKRLTVITAIDNIYFHHQKVTLRRTKLYGGRGQTSPSLTCGWFGKFEWHGSLVILPAMHLFLTLLDLSWRTRPSSVVPPLTRVSQKPLHGSRPNFVEKLPIRYISRPFFFFSQNFWFQIFTIFFSFSLTWEPKFQKVTSPTISSDFTQTLNMIVMGGYRLLLFWRSAKTYKLYGTLNFLLTEDHMGLEISKRYCATVFI